MRHQLDSLPINKVLAFIYKDFIEETSYKFSFLLQFFSVFFSTLTFFFLSKLLGDFGRSYLDPYGGDYFAFVLIGVAFFSYFEVSLNSLSNKIREGQMLGTIEALLITQTEIPTIILSSSLYSFIWTSFKILLYLLLGTLVFGIDMHDANLIGALVILILTITSFSSLGILSASFIMVLKKGDPINWFFTSISKLLGGLYYPVSVLPDWLQSFSYFLPITYSLEGMRLATLKGYSLNKLMPNILPLLIFSTVMLPVSIIVFKQAIRKAKNDGTLTQY